MCAPLLTSYSFHLGFTTSQCISITAFWSILRNGVQTCLKSSSVLISALSGPRPLSCPTYFHCAVFLTFSHQYFLCSHLLAWWSWCYCVNVIKSCSQILWRKGESSQFLSLSPLGFPKLPLFHVLRLSQWSVTLWDHGHVVNRSRLWILSSTTRCSLFLKMENIKFSFILNQFVAS